MKLKPLDAANRFIEEIYPNSSIVILAGSVVREQSTSSSDLDILIIDETENTMSRNCFEKFGWPIETFVYNIESFYTFYEGDCLLGNPILPRMCAEGIILKGGEMARQLQAEAKLRLIDGPLPWTEDQINYSRYMITDSLEDLIGSEDETESLFITNKLAELVHEFILRTNQKWTGQGKWLARAFRQYDEQQATEFFNRFNEYYKGRKKHLLIEYIDMILKPYGGRLFNGYRQ
ncbi:nucleotidyltransferase domain-containing protein [Bacillus sp. Marseille-P3661]|uniref:nucleotidyltransferase domain-containing protein n=1 Tax=Bacillus sp. Marseille-P3661 TaxID=1936234 RepID=UPI000C83F500|nr:nucleotidyltransferase domain-containing protein [Bacillus sp. Marseille-P3661]